MSQSHRGQPAVPRDQLGAIELADRLADEATSPRGIPFDVAVKYAARRAAQFGIGRQGILAALDQVKRQRRLLTSAAQRPGETTDALRLRSGLTLGWEMAW